MQTPSQILKKYFGYDQFRPNQSKIIDSILKGQDVLTLMPTGGGKSVCFQVPALLKEGLTVVVSPLIALMKDQVEALKINGIEAAYLNSSQDGSQQRQIEDRARSGQLKLLYVSPEKMVSESFLGFLRGLQISMFAIDEAHCISSWGHDFRPEYQQLGVLKQFFPTIPVAAFTATADRLTRQDIITQLKLNDPAVYITSFDRPNLSLRVLPGTKRLQQILKFVREKPNTSGIVYCNSRKQTESLAQKLNEAGFNAGFYHAGMETPARSRTQEAFVRDDLKIVCATVAFGMGIDKSNVRWVIHYGMPKNLEGYYQEIGRAGRDGLAADTVLFYSFADVMNWRDMISENKPANLEFQLAKLERMQQYADANSCRRRILLSYFSEEIGHDCGNCDVCKNPRKSFDGTVIAQKALSAAIRLREEVPMNMLIDVLRGSRNQTIVARGYDHIKTYGAGADLKYEEWRDYLWQLINMGVLEVAYEQRHALRRGALADAVLTRGQNIQLVKPEHTIKINEVAVESERKEKTRTDIVRDELFEKLRVLRKAVADKLNVPPYLVFSDATLSDLAQKRPATPEQLLGVSGVGQRKLEQFGAPFLKLINDYTQEKGLPVSTDKNTGTNSGQSTQLVSFEMYKNGLSVEQIAKQRNLTEYTVIGHLVAMFEAGADIDLSQFIEPAERAEIAQVIREIGIIDNRIKPIFDALDARFEYYKIKIVVALLQ